MTVTASSIHKERCPAVTFSEGKLQTRPPPAPRPPPPAIMKDQLEERIKALHLHAQISINQRVNVCVCSSESLSDSVNQTPVSQASNQHLNPSIQRSAFIHTIASAAAPPLLPSSPQFSLCLAPPPPLLCIVDVFTTVKLHSTY